VRELNEPKYHNILISSRTAPILVGQAVSPVIGLVGQDEILRPIGNRPSCSEVQLTGAPIDNRRQAASLPHKGV